MQSTFPPDAVKHLLNGSVVDWNRTNCGSLGGKVPSTGRRLSAPWVIMKPMKTFTAVVEKDSDTDLYVGYVPGFPGAHTQGETLDELHANLREVIGLLSRRASRTSKPNS